MKKLLLIIILHSTLYTLNSFAQPRQNGGQEYGWYIIDPVSIPGTLDFSDLFFTDANIGWITSSSQVNIYKTQDGAASFSTQTTPLGATQAIQMLDASNGYSGGDGGWVYKTDDGGLNWNILATMGSLTDISSLPAQTRIIL